MHPQALGLPNLQGAYDASNAVPHILLAAAQPFTIRDAATPIGDVFILETFTGGQFFKVTPSQLSFGDAGTRLLEMNSTDVGKGGIRYYPDGASITAETPNQAVLQWDSVVTTNVPGGAPFGNDTAPAMISSTGECIFLDQPFLFSTSLLFNQASILTSDGWDLGPIYTMVHQPTVRNMSANTITVSQMNAVRAQARIGPNLLGNLTQTSIEYFYATILVDGTVGTVNVVDAKYFSAVDPTLTAGGTVTTLTVLNIPAMINATNIYGINSALTVAANRRFIRHIGTAQSDFGGVIGLGSGATIDVLLSRGAANRLDLGSGDSLKLNGTGQLDHAVNDALGGGAVATLGTIGGTGPTAAAQSKWVRIKVAGVDHWIPAWL